MALDLDEPLNLYVPENGYQGQVSADAAGIIATFYTLNYLYYTNRSDLYHLLLNYAHQHPERRKIAGAIDCRQALLLWESNLNFKRIF
ncbi:antirestriction protein [Legionella sp. CNM-1927-20]|uniref:antirestriction protein n=1 Tax=Legionella sp. CNM-1927-20 TaxID=3422221 RepID=UPI00403ABC68